MRVYRNGTVVFVKIDNPTTSLSYFQWQCRNEVEAEGLVQYFNGIIENRVRRFATHYYNLGWKHAKARKPKHDFFPSHLRDIKEGDQF